jgi:hypothetical protein
VVPDRRCPVHGGGGVTGADRTIGIDGRASATFAESCR